AIDSLTRVQADRRTIFLFSDGLAEDKAYFHSDVITSARKNGVVINSLGYPRSVSLSVALQVIRRLSEETGGVYVEANDQLKLPETFLRDPLQSVDNGGRFTIDLKDVSYENVPENTGIALTFATSSGNIAIKLPVQRPEVRKEAVAEPAPVSKPAPKAQPSTPAPEPVRVTTVPAVQAVAPDSTAASSGKGLERWFLYGIPIALVVLLLLTIATLIISYIKPRERDLPQVQLGDLKPYAYLVLQDESKRRYPITRTTWRIGRSKDNELSLDDNSISRRHAEIHRSQGDEFTIIDLDSLNGVFINSEKVKIQQLKEGDIVEIGDVDFRFTLHSAEYSLEESTVMQKTKSPSYTH
ncbi:MAG: FHA domain-containing protein, partial [Gammaproteobacteria bacterium]|nr:FHA domain-containing protein [Gammaproteobacteria bacterium]